MRKLLVIIQDRLSEIIEKGEITERYYNPGDLFDEVHILMTNDDTPDPAPLGRMVGRARLVLHNLPAGRLLAATTLGWQSRLLKRWAEPAISIARELRPDLIRCHGCGVNAFIAHQVNRKFGVPYVVSLHTNPDQAIYTDGLSHARLASAKAFEKIQNSALQNARLVLPVYKPIIPYLDRLNVKNYRVAYNVLNPSHLRRKEDYALHSPPRIICVGRQIIGKIPENLIIAVSKLPDARLSMIGDGEYHEYLKKVAEGSGAGDRIEFIRAMPNDELCDRMTDYDIFAAHSDYTEISKAVLEPLLSGMPVIVNRLSESPVPELEGDFAMLVNNTSAGYHSALKLLIEDDKTREKTGRRAFEHSRALWDPSVTEANFAGIYTEIISSK
ncbi:MAG TPA: glycosyltransferase [bacterium]|nr:glycosyltransferase [bacterium]